MFLFTGLHDTTWLTCKAAANE